MFFAGSDTANPDFTNAVKAHALARNLILLTCGVYGNVIRFLAPITIQDDVFAEALDIIEASIRAARADAGKERPTVPSGRKPPQPVTNGLLGRYSPSLSRKAYHHEPTIEYCSRNMRPPGNGNQRTLANTSKRLRSPSTASDKIRPNKCEPVTPWPL